jgi:hypothetical protein
MAVGPCEISALVTSFKVVLDLARGTKAAIDALDDAEVKFKMADLYSALADAKVAVADAQESMTAKDREIERLKATFQSSADRNGAMRWPDRQSVRSLPPAWRA